MGAYPCGLEDFLICSTTPGFGPSIGPHLEEVIFRRRMYPRCLIRRIAATSKRRKRMPRCRLRIQTRKLGGMTRFKLIYFFAAHNLTFKCFHEGEIVLIILGRKVRS